MVSLDSVLRTGVSGLAANQAALNTTSNNIANVNTKGYVRRQVGFETKVLGGNPVGVKAASSIRAINEFLVREERTVLAQEKRFEAMQTIHSELQSLLGSPGDDLTFTGKLDKAFSQITALSTDPNGNVPRTTALQQLEDFSTEINRISELLQKLRGDADTRIDESLVTINNEIDKINTLNLKIVRQTNLGADTTTLVEQRDNSLLTLSEFTDIITFKMNEGGAIGVSTGNGQVLLDNLKRELSYQSVGTITPSTEFEQIKIQKVTPEGTLEEVDVLDPFLKSGSLFGFVEMRDVEIPNMMEALGELTANVIDQFNLVHNNHSPVPPPSALTGRNIGILSTDNHNFTGKVTIATVNASNVLVDRVEIDFTNSTVAKNGGGTVAIGGNTIGHVITAVNNQFGGIALSITAGSLSAHAATGVGVATVQDSTIPSSRGGRGFAHFFGINDLMTSNQPGHFETGFATTDAHGFGNTGAITIDLKGPRGQTAKSFTLDFATAGVTSFADIVSALNEGFKSFASFELNSNGELIASPLGSHSNFHFSTNSDDTNRGTTTKKFSEVFGFARNFRIDQSFNVGVRSDIFADINQLSIAELDLTAGTSPALTVGDNRGIIDFQNLRDKSINFTAAGTLNETSRSLSEYAALVLADVAIKAEDADSRLEDTSALKAELSARVKNDSGVNIDEELANMILFQNAFNASARLIASTRQMFDELLKLAE